MRSRSESLEMALLGLLMQSPLHGYELRKRMGSIFGPFRVLSFSVLYPLLRKLLEGGFIEENLREAPVRRARIVYQVTDRGKARFEFLSESTTPDAWDDDAFGLRFAFFGPISHKSRLRILEARHRRLKDRAELFRTELEKSQVALDKYLTEWRLHCLDSADREIAWIEEMMNKERKISGS